MPVRLVMLGLSHSHSHGNARAAAMVDQVQLVGIWDTDSQLARRRRTEWADYHRNLTIFDSLEQALSADHVDGVIVDGQVPENLSLALAAVERRKHVLLEKPAGLALEPFVELHHMATERNLRVQMGYIMRYNAGFELVRHLCDAGALGDIVSVRGRISWERAGYDHHMPQIGRLPGGMLLELGCHYLDLILTLLGRPKAATGFFGRHYDSARRYTDNALAVLEYDRAFATIETCAMESGALQNRSFEVYGTTGTVVIQPLEPPEVMLHLDAPWEQYRQGWQSAPINPVPRHVRDLREFADCIRGRKEPDFAPGHDLAVQETLLEMCATDR